MTQNFDIIKKKIILIGKILLPSIFCTLSILFLEHYIEFQDIAVFGISIILFNYRKTKTNFLGSFLISIILSYIVFFLSLAIYGGTSYILSRGDIEKVLDGYILGVPYIRLNALITVSIISPLLMFFCYKILFKIKKNENVVWIKIISIIILFTSGLTDFFFADDNIVIIWESVMAISLQLILYKKALFNNHNIVNSD